MLAHVFNITDGLDDSIHTKGGNFLICFRNLEPKMFGIDPQTVAPAHQIGNRIGFNFFTPDI
jgi:hypothetical protein